MLDSLLPDPGWGRLGVGVETAHRNLFTPALTLSLKWAGSELTGFARSVVMEP